MKKSVLILNWRCPKNPKAGGAEKVTLKHASYWVEKGFEVTWLAGNFAAEKEENASSKGSVLKAPREEIIQGVKIIRYGNPYTVYLLAPFLYWFRWRGKFDVIVDEIHGIPFFTPLWAWRSKKIAYIHEVAGEIWDEMFKPPFNWLGKIAERIYLLMYRKIKFWTVSESTKDNLVKHDIPEKNVVVIPNGIEVKASSLKPLVSSLKEGKLTLISVSRIVPMKRVDKIIELFAEVKKQVKDAQLWIVGDGDKDYIKNLKVKSQKSKVAKDVKWWGYVEEEKKRELLTKAHFLVNMSVKEGFGLVVLEANAQGTPAVGMRVAGLKDVIQEGVNGILIKDIKSGTQKIVSLYQDKRHYQKLAYSSLEYVKEYNWEKILGSSFKLISSL